MYYITNSITISVRICFHIDFGGHNGRVDILAGEKRDFVAAL
jgi:hypothetical protein